MNPIRIQRAILFGILACAAILAVPILLWARPAAAQEPLPLVVDADEVSYDEATQIVEARGNVRLSYKGIRLTADHAVFDLRQERLTATGHVVLIDAQGRELRGERLTYDVRTEQAEVTRAQTIVDKVHIRSDRVETKGNQITAYDATFTTCDPDRPAYRITASRIEVFPGDRIVAYAASLWVGRYKIITLPVQVISLRSAEETARSVPRIGYNNVDGLWVDYTYLYFPGPLRGSLYSKYGTRSGFIINNTLGYSKPGYGISLAVGRSQNVDLKIFDLAELTFAIAPRRLGTFPLLLDFSSGAGWFRETVPDISTSRFQYRVGLSTTAISLSPRTSWQAGVSWLDAYYGNGARQSVLGVGSSVTHNLSPSSSLSLSYRLVEVYGATPFAFDVIGLESRFHDLSLQYSRTGTRAGGVQTTLRAGTTYYFRSPLVIGGIAVSFPGPQSVAVNLGYGERAPDRYHWTFGAEYNLTIKASRLTMDSGLALGRGTYFTIQAIYNTGVSTFEDLDYIITSRLCDCIDVSLKYRQVRKEIWFEIGLTAFPQTRLQFSPTGTR